MKRLRFIVILVTVAALCGCGHYIRPEPAASFPYRAYNFDVKFAWETAPTASGLLVQGVLKNARYPYIDSFQLYLSLQDKDGRKVEQEAFGPIPTPIAIGDVRPFQVTFHHPPPPGGTLQFLYYYMAREPGSGVTWMNSFQTYLATGAVLPKPNERPPSEF